MNSLPQLGRVRVGRRFKQKINPPLEKISKIVYNDKSYNKK